MNLANHANDDVIRSDQFETLTGTNSTGGVTGCAILGLEINANSANQSFGTQTSPPTSPPRGSRCPRPRST